MRPRHALLSLLLLAGVAPAGPVEAMLPFLPAGGATWPQDATGVVAVPLLPAPASGAIGSPPGEAEEALPLLRPNVGALFEGIEGSLTIHEGVVRFDGEPREAERVRRLLGAVRAALGRRVRIELTIGEGDGSVRLAEVVPEGALLEEDARVERSWPAAVHDETKVAAASAVRYRLGTAVRAAASRRGDGGWTLRIALETARLAGERRIEGDGPTLVVPEIAFATLVADLPVRPGETGRLRAEGPRVEGDLALAWRVVVVEEPAVPEGVRVQPLHALRRLAGIVSGDEFETPDEPAPPEIPATWATPGVRLALVPPDLVVAEGPPDALARFDAAVAAWWRARGPDLEIERTRPAGGGRPERTVLPVAGGSRLTLAHGVLRAFAGRTATSIAQDIARATVEPVRLLEGRTVVVETGETARIEVRRAAVADVVTEPRPVPRDGLDGHLVERHPFDRTRVNEERSAVRLAPGEADEPGDGESTAVRRIER